MSGPRPRAVRVAATVAALLALPALAGCSFEQTHAFFAAPAGALNAALNLVSVVGILLLFLDARRRDRGRREPPRP